MIQERHSHGCSSFRQNGKQIFAVSPGFKEGQSVVEFLQFPNILEVADSSFQTLLESVKEHDRSLNDLSASNKAIHIWSFLHGISSISKKMDVALSLPDSEMPIPVRSVKRARSNLRQFIEDLF